MNMAGTQFLNNNFNSAYDASELLRMRLFCMVMDYLFLYDKYYPKGTEVRQILEKHSSSVANLALDINSALHLGLPPEEVKEAAMLHDIGIFLTNADGIDCHGTEPYLRHGVLGADLLRKEGYPEWCARVAERHTGAGISVDDIEEMHLSLPLDRVLMPETKLERLVCYADKFYSKSGDMKRKSLARVRQSMARHSQSTVERFEKLYGEFGAYNTDL